MPWLGPADQAWLPWPSSTHPDRRHRRRQGAGYIGQNLSGVLRALGGAPAERKALGVEEQVAGKLAALRAGRQR
jgi:hypothetical protein